MKTRKAKVERWVKGQPDPDQVAMDQFADAEIERQESQHTPTPWNWRQEDDGGITIYQAGQPYQQTVMSHEGASGNVPYRGVPEDAAFIVRAVNSHEELLKQLKSIHRHYQGKDMVNGEHTYVCSACETIAKAEGI